MRMREVKERTAHTGVTCVCVADVNQALHQRMIKICRELANDQKTIR